MTANDTAALIHKALNNVTTRPAGYALLGRGDGSGVIVANANRRLLYYFTLNQPPVTAPLIDTISILPFLGAHPELEGLRVSLGNPPGRPNVLYITGFDQGEGADSFAGMTPSEQLQAARSFTDVGSLTNLRGAPNNPVDSEVYINPGFFINATGAQDWWGGDSTQTLCATAIAALASGEHQMAIIYIDNTTGALDIATNTAEVGGVNDKQLFDTTTVTEITLPDFATPAASVHLYDGQTEVTEDDIYRTADPRIVFRNTGSGGGMISFTVAGDSGTPQTLTDGNTLTIAGGDGISTVASATDTLTANVDATVIRTTGTQSIGTGLTIDTPTIPNFTNAQHDHLDADDGGTLTPAIFGTQTANRILSGPTTGAAATPTFRAMVTADIPDEIVTLAKLSDGTAGKIFGYTNAGEADQMYPYIDQVVTWGETMTVRAAVHRDPDDGKWYKASGDSADFLMGDDHGLVSDAGTGVFNTAGRVRILGPLEGFSALTANEPVWLSTTAGVLTQTMPSPSLAGVTVAQARFGTAMAADTIFVDDYPVQYLRRASLANSATLTVGHHADAGGRTRQPHAAVSTDDIGLLEQSGGAQDSSRQLRGQSGAGTTTTVDTAGASTFALGDSAGTDYQVAQSFTVAAAGQLSSFTAQSGPTTGMGTPATVTWTLYDNSGAIPGAVLATGTMPTWVASSTNTGTVTNGPFLVTGTTYWLGFSVPIQATNNFYTVLRNATNPYANGQMKADQTTGASFPGTWNSAALGAGNDMRCAITLAAVVTNDGLAQGFVHTTTTTVTSAKILLKKTGAPTGNMTLAIYSDSGGLPNAVITNGTATVVAASTLTTSYVLTTFTFPTPPTITTSVQYHLVLTTADSASNTNYVEWGIDISSPPYASGVFELLNPTWSNANPAADGLFEIYGVTTTFGEPALCGRWGGSIARDFGVRYDDGSGGSASTNTTFKNTSGVTLDVTCIVGFA